MTVQVRKTQSLRRRASKAVDRMRMRAQRIKALVRERPIRLPNGITLTRWHLHAAGKPIPKYEVHVIPETLGKPGKIELITGKTLTRVLTVKGTRLLIRRKTASSEMGRTNTIESQRLIHTAIANLTKQKRLQPAYVLKPVKYYAETPHYWVSEYNGQPTVQEIELAAKGYRLPGERQAIVDNFFRQNSVKNPKQFANEVRVAFTGLQRDMKTVEFVSSVAHMIELEDKEIEELDTHNSNVIVHGHSREGKIVFSFLNKTGIVTQQGR